MNFEGWTGFGVWLTGHALGLLAALHAVQNKKRNPSGALVWVLFCIAVPYGGALIYLLIGYDRVTKRRRRSVRAAHVTYRVEARERRRVETDPDAATASAGKGEPTLCPYPSVQHLSDFPARQGNAVEVTVGGAATYERMLSAIRGARVSIRLQTYIFDDDDDGRSFVAALIERAAAGVDVRVLYDAVGTSARGARLISSIAAGGGKVAAFLPFHPLKRRFQINLRNHRKILVLDDERAFVGSHNISARHRRSGPVGSRDLMLDLRGPAVEDLADVFASDWRFATGDRIAVTTPVAAPEKAGRQTLQVFDSGPDQVDGGVKNAILTALYQARYDVLILTPYFVPPPELLTAVQSAAARKVRVRLMIPGRCSHRLMNWATRSFLTPLLVAGVEIHERPDAFLHMKLMVIDDTIAIAGSTNLDYRSFHLNFEADVVAYGGPLHQALRGVAEAEWQASIRLGETRFHRLPYLERILLRIAALFSPIL